MCDERSVGSPPDPWDVSRGRARALRRVVLGYQNHLSPLKLGPSCRFEPSCSAYSLIAFSRHGVVRGFLLSVARLAKCGPWHPGGWDPVPPVRRRTRR
ncbi:MULTISPECIES: membrane protein insertion efficiency factor YidD [Corynebacterium]|uniref:membrane protein insertion efficiency factor YidD n=1 Tax=Corynebacterium TaxID=1716 RepID=UPI0011AB67BC|nr:MULTISPECIES: membrane protein insertion efficiency factor YidD [Corynebacterium]MDN5682594.1 membrane protein insertion efficiency factor YidD [Corynebacterium glyciniphilum]MDN6707106.1 membrane protein insertion efficiency factor YidD [Corynebacterium glyciniphilum]